MPLSLEEKRIFFPSAENDAPLTVVVAMNCSIEYCFSGRWLPEPLLPAWAATEVGLAVARVNARLRTVVRRIRSPFACPPKGFAGNEANFIRSGAGEASRVNRLTFYSSSPGRIFAAESHQTLDLKHRL